MGELLARLLHLCLEARQLLLNVCLLDEHLAKLPVDLLESGAYLRLARALVTRRLLPLTRQLVNSVDERLALLLEQCPGRLVVTLDLLEDGP